MPAQPKIDLDEYDGSQCPYCEAELPQDEVEYLPWWRDLLNLLLVVVVIANLISAVCGVIYGVDRDHTLCHSWGKLRYDYVIPGYNAGCMAGRFLTNQRFITQEDYEAHRYDEESWR